jgi:hypothetical protein
VQVVSVDDDDQPYFVILQRQGMLDGSSGSFGPFQFSERWSHLHLIHSLSTAILCCVEEESMVIAL